jgi:GxxExxY protein
MIGRENEERCMLDSKLTEKIIGSAIEVHKHWGPGLLENIYEKSLCRELRLRKIEFKSQVDLPLVYKGEEVGESLRLDIIVENRVVVELKAVKAIEPIHEAQLLTYMKITGNKVGLLVNFNVPVLKDGIKRMVL